MYLIASTAGNSIVVNTKEEWTGIELGVGSNLYFFLTEKKLPSFKGQMSFLLVVFLVIFTQKHLCSYKWKYKSTISFQR